MALVAIIVGTRPNYMKVAPVFHALRQSRRIDTVIVDGGQHRGTSMSEVFRNELMLPRSDYQLSPASGTSAARIAHMVVGFDWAFRTLRPDRVLVPGDVNSTLAAALAAEQNQIPVAHLEAGLRSFDRGMPEETNRVLVDHLSDLHLTPSVDADANLRNEGITDSVHRVGNAMVDSVNRCLPRAREALPSLRRRLELPETYALCTFHRPSNVDRSADLERILEALVELSRTLPVAFPVHPRTRPQVEASSAMAAGHDVRLLEPLPYLEFLALESSAAVVLTDSGGVQEETTVLGVPCITVRHNTERPVTISEGTNVLAPPGEVDVCRLALERVAEPRPPREVYPELWDGRTGERVARVLEDVML